MTVYRLLVCDLRTDRLLDRLPITGVGYDDYIGKTGSLSGAIPVPDSTMARRVREAMLTGRTQVWLERGREIVWGGIAWTRTPTRDDRGRWTVPVQAAGVESYLREHRRLFADQTSTAVDQLDIARSLVTYMQAQAGGDIGIEADPSVLSGVLRTRAYSRYDQPGIGQLLDELAAVDGGFEWRIRCWRSDDGARHKSLVLGYPTITYGTTDTVLSSPGPILGYSLPEDATGQANTWQSRGASVNTSLAVGSVPLMSALLTSPADIAAGWPALDGSSDYSAVADQPTLDGYASADLARARMPVTIPAVRILASAGVPVLGSTVRLRIRDIWYYDGLDARYRLVGVRVQPPERGRAEIADLYLEAT